MKRFPKFTEYSNWFEYENDDAGFLLRWHRRYFSAGKNYLFARLWFTPVGVDLLWNSPAYNSAEGKEYGVRLMANFSFGESESSKLARRLCARMYRWSINWFVLRREPKAIEGYEIPLLKERIKTDGKFYDIAIPAVSDGRRCIGIDPNERATQPA